MRFFSAALCLLVLTLALCFPLTHSSAAVLIEITRPPRPGPLYYDNGTYCQTYTQYADTYSCPTAEITNECTLQSTRVVYSENFCW